MGHRAGFDARPAECSAGLRHFNQTGGRNARARLAARLQVGAILGSAATVLLILAMAYVANKVATRVVRRLITPRVPRIQREAPEQLAARSGTISAVVARAISVLIGAIALITVLAELGLNVSALLATVGVASLARGVRRAKHHSRLPARLFHPDGRLVPGGRGCECGWHRRSGC